MTISEVLTAPRSPWQNGHVERFIGSVRRECLDHVIVFNAVGVDCQKRRICAAPGFSATIAKPALIYFSCTAPPFCVDGQQEWSYLTVLLCCLAVTSELRAALNPSVRSKGPSMPTATNSRCVPLRIRALAITILLAWTSNAHAQITAATISGTVNDQKDKQIVFVEGASHVLTSCRPEYGDTVKRMFDYVDGWLGDGIRFGRAAGSK